MGSCVVSASCSFMAASFAFSRFVRHSKSCKSNALRWVLLRWVLLHWVLLPNILPSTELPELLATSRASETGPPATPPGVPAHGAAAFLSRPPGGLRCVAPFGQSSYTHAPVLL
jgi:hypothetical protein